MLRTATVIAVPAPSTAASLLAQLPFPAAYQLAFAREPALDSTLRLNNAIFAAYQSTRLGALLRRVTRREVRMGGHG